MSDVTLKIIDVLLPAVLALIAAAIAYGTAYLRSKAMTIQQTKVRDMATSALDRAKEEVYDAMRATAQTFVDDLKASRENGKLTPQDVEHAKIEAWGHFKTQMGAAALTELERVVGDVAGWFASELEAAVGNVKT